MKRTIVIGDVHGCRRELEQLLDKIGFALGDRLVFVGDLVARGPDSPGVLDLARTTGAVIVRGNHEERLIATRKDASHPFAWGSPPGDAVFKKPLGRLHLDVVRQLRPVDWTLLESSRLYLDLPEHDLRVVHAGLVPGVAIEDQRRKTLLTIRSLGRKGEPKGSRKNVLWGQRYQGPPHVVFGHNARREPQLHRWATGIDTACVYGGALTALVLEEGQKIPRTPMLRRRLLAHVSAAKVYYEPRRMA